MSFETGRREWFCLKLLGQTLLNHRGRFYHLRGRDGVKGGCYGMIACEEWGIVFGCKMKSH